MFGRRFYGARMFGPRYFGGVGSDIAPADFGWMLFIARREPSFFVAQEVMSSSDFRFPDHPGLDPDESCPVILDLYPLCANFWRSNEEVAELEFVRPTKATGFSYEVTTAGLTGWREPKWPTTIGETVPSGSAVLTCRAAGTNGINAIIDPSSASEPSGLVISGVSVSESRRIMATYSTDADSGEEFDAVYTFTLNGVTRVARQRVPVKKR